MIGDLQEVPEQNSIFHSSVLIGGFIRAFAKDEFKTPQHPEDGAMAKITDFVLAAHNFCNISPPAIGTIHLKDYDPMPALNFNTFYKSLSPGCGIYIFSTQTEKFSMSVSQIIYGVDFCGI